MDFEPTLRSRFNAPLFDIAANALRNYFASSSIVHRQ